MHPPLNNHLPVLPMQLPSTPPPDAVDGMDFDDGENNLGLHEAIQGVAQLAQTLHHPTLNGMSFIYTFCYIFNRLL